MFIKFGRRIINTDEISLMAEQFTSDNVRKSRTLTMSDGSTIRLEPPEADYLDTQLGTSLNTGYVAP